MRVGVIYNPHSSFEDADRFQLSGHFEIESIFSLYGLTNLTRYRESLKTQLKDCDVMYTWFGGWHAYLAERECRKLKIPMVVCAGGYDVARVEEIGYGASLNFKERYVTLKSLKNADLVLSVSKSNQAELLKLVKPKANKLIYNGANARFYHPDPEMAKKRQMVTVSVLKHSNVVKKGILNAITVASYCDDVPLYIVGKDMDGTSVNLEKKSSPNVHLTGYLTDVILRDMYRQSQFYVQLSAHESFGISVVEAMMCGCVPIVSDRYALPEVVGDAGIIVPWNNNLQPASVLKSIEPEEVEHLSELAIKRASEFTVDIRAERLAAALEEVTRR